MTFYCVMHTRVDYSRRDTPEEYWPAKGIPVAVFLDKTKAEEFAQRERAKMGVLALENNSVAVFSVESP